MIAVVNDNLLADLFLFQNAGNGFQNIFFLRLVNMPVLPTLDPAEKCDTYLIRGCQSRVWLVPENRDGLVFFRGESDAVIVKGLVALLLRVVSGRTPRELLENPLHFIDEIGLNQHLSPTRANGLLAMVKQIRLYAVAYQRLEEK